MHGRLDTGADNSDSSMETKLPQDYHKDDSRSLGGACTAAHPAPVDLPWELSHSDFRTSRLRFIGVGGFHFAVR